MRAVIIQNLPAGSEARRAHEPDRARSRSTRSHRHAEPHLLACPNVGRHVDRAVPTGAADACEAGSAQAAAIAMASGARRL